MLVLLACHSPAKPKQERPVQIDTMLLIAPPAHAATKVASNEVSVVNKDSVTYIRFGDCYFSLDWIYPDAQRNDFELHPDTLFFKLAYKHTIEGQMLAITAGANEKMKVWQRYETSAIIEGSPTLALLQWKHHRSDWEALKEEASNFYLCKKYTPEEKQLFPEANINELRQQIKQHFGRLALSRIAGLCSFPSGPAKVAISRYFLKVSGTLNHSADKINKLLVIDVAFKG